MHSMRILRLDTLGAAEQFCVGGEIERVQALKIIPRAILGHRDQVDRAVWSECAVDHGRGSNADLRLDMAASA
jgi:hypothetical protein